MASAVSAHFERERRGLPGWGSLAPLYRLFVLNSLFVARRLYIRFKTHTIILRGHTYTI